MTDQLLEGPAVLQGFLPLAALIYVFASHPAHAHAQHANRCGLPGRIVDSVTGRALLTATVPSRAINGFTIGGGFTLLGGLPSRTAK